LKVALKHQKSNQIKSDQLFIYKYDLFHNMECANK